MSWKDIASDKDKVILDRGRFGVRLGFGIRPAMLCIDFQVFEIGDRDEPQEESNKRFPQSAGHAGWVAAEQTARLLKVAREAGVPVYHTMGTVSPNGSDGGVYLLKRGGALNIPNWRIENTPGAEISPLVKPEPGEIVISKKKNSAFFGTPLVSYLIDGRIDTLLITGGTTSNCIRATVFDAVSYNFRPIIIEECVFDRLEISHKVNLFDMDRQYGDVVSLEEAITYLRHLQK